jgi:rRNA maturation endonuclease Nob1
VEKYICHNCQHIYYAERKNECPACGSIVVYNINEHVKWVTENSILGKSFAALTPEEKEDLVRFASELFYPIRQKKH